jgi:hypothetical protein
MRRVTISACCAALALLVACDESDDDAASDTEEAVVPVAKWDANPAGETWTEASLAALAGHGAPLVAVVPSDTGTWCPAYPDASDDGRKAFWVGLLSALSEHESTWRPDAVGGGGKWFGLVQISPATAKGYGCNAQTGEALKNGAANLSCAIRIWSETVPRDGVIAADGGGVAADWGPFNQSNKRTAMQEWVSSQSYCKS